LAAKISFDIWSRPEALFAQRLHSSLEILSLPV
jgi:hypothetical protein